MRAGTAAALRIVRIVSLTPRPEHHSYSIRLNISRARCEGRLDAARGSGGRVFDRARTAEQLDACGWTAALGPSRPERVQLGDCKGGSWAGRMKRWS